MIVDYLDLKSVAINPTEANPPLVVDPNAVPPYPITGEDLQPIPSNCSQIGNGRGRMHLIELALCHRGNTLKLPAELAPEDLFGLPVPERPDHSSRVLPFRV